MTRKIYRTAQGRQVDLGSLQLQYENIRAVGNMGVNSRGDILDADNRPISTRNQQVAKQYQRQVTNVSDTPMSKNKRSAPIKADIPTPPEDFDDTFEKVELESPTIPESVAPTTGLAAAIARAREIKQEPIKSPRQVAQSGKINRV
jgi:hypothetical protein